MEAHRFRNLSARQRAVVAIGLLLDGREAENYLENDSVFGSALSKAAHDLADQPPDLRMPFVGTMLRIALREMSQGKVEGKRS